MPRYTVFISLSLLLLLSVFYGQVTSIPKATIGGGTGSAVVNTVGPTTSSSTSVSIPLGSGLSSGTYRVSLVVQTTDTSDGTCNVNATTTNATFFNGIDGTYQYTLIDSDTPRNLLNLNDGDGQSQGSNLVYLPATDDITVDITTSGGGCTNFTFRYIAKLEQL